MNAIPDLDRLRREAATGSPLGLFTLAQALLAGGQPGDAVAPLRAAAQAGHVDAQVEWARLLLWGIGGPTDVTQAVDWLQRAERTQHPGASYLLASIALGGIALDRDLEQIGRRLAHAAQGGIVPALRALALYFGRQRDNLAAMHQSEALLAQAAAQHDGVSAALLAERMRSGELVGGARYALEALDAVAREAGITAMPSLPGVRVTSGNQDPLRLDLASSLRAPAFAPACQTPRVAMTEGLLSNEECRYVIAMGAPHLRRAWVADPKTGAPMDHPARENDDVSFVSQLEDFQLRLLQLRMGAAIGIDFTCAEPMVLLRYRPGQAYLLHRDDLPADVLAANRPEAGQRVASLFCYLNNVKSGGETYFPTPERVVAPVAGRAVALRNVDELGRPDPDSLHAGLPVKAGEKWLATLWLRERRLRDF